MTKPPSRIAAGAAAMSVFACAAVLWGCTPTVRVATDEPITINLNVNIQHEIRVKVEDELEEMFSEDSEVF